MGKNKKKARQRKQEQRKARRKQKKAKKAGKSAASSPSESSFGTVRKVTDFEDLRFVKRMRERMAEEGIRDDDGDDDPGFSEQGFGDDPFGDDPFGDIPFDDDPLTGLPTIEEGPPEVLRRYEATLFRLGRAESEEEARALAEEALAIHPKGLRARAIRAANAPTPAQRAEELAELVEELRKEEFAADFEEQLSDQVFSRGRFFLQILADLGATLTECRRYEEGAAVFAELRERKPDEDTEDLRMAELECLVALGRGPEARALVDDRHLCLCCLRYATALLTFLAEGDGPAARAALAEAWEMDLERRWVEPARGRRIAELGRDAACVGLRRGDVCDAEALWATRPEALDWLEQRLAEQGEPPRPDTPASTLCSSLLMPFEDLAFGLQLDWTGDLTKIDFDDETERVLSVVEAIVAHLDRVCLAHLDGEYRLVCRLVVRALFVDHRAALSASGPRSVAAGIASFVARRNGLSDPEHEPTLSPAELAALFGLSAEAADQQARAIEAALKPAPHDWLRPSQWDRHPKIAMSERPAVLAELMEEAELPSLLDFEPPKPTDRLTEQEAGES